MSKLGCSIIACVCIITGLISLLHSLFAPRWMSACVSLAAVVLDQKNGDPQAASIPDLLSKMESPKFPPQGTGSLVMDQQLLKEKSWLFENLKSKKICLSEGFFGYCLFGDGVLRFGNYHMCIENDVERPFSRSTESLTAFALIISACGAVLSLALLLLGLRIQWCRGNVKAVDIMRSVTALITFASGTLVLLGLLPTAAQAISYSSNPTNFYNDMVSRIGASYLFELEVNWAVGAGDVTVAQAWARTIVHNMTGLGLDRDFFIALAAVIFFYSACAALLIRSNAEQTEKYPSSLSANHKQS